jgi:hypothetical protein
MHLGPRSRNKYSLLSVCIAMVDVRILRSEHPQCKNELRPEDKKNKKNERSVLWRYWESNPGFESIYDVHNLMSYL